MRDNALLRWTLRWRRGVYLPACHALPTSLSWSPSPPCAAACARPPATATRPPAPAAGVAGASTSIEAPPQPVAPDALADSVLVDVRSADSTIQVDARYATPNNFTGAPLPGYEAPRALLRREVAAALARVQARLRTGDMGLRVFDGYRPVRATLAMVDWAERTGRRALLDSGTSPGAAGTISGSRWI